MTTPEPTEGRAGVGRIEAFSDGVLAIIITIMVLELEAPKSPDPAALRGLAPTLLAYALSYLYVAIYWVNHHRLFSHATRVTNALLWANIALLFTLSLLPFTTAWVGHFLASGPVAAIYLGSLLLPSLAYFWLLTAIRRSGRQDEAAQRYYRASARKGIAATLVYAAGIAASLLSPAAGLGLAALVAVFWMLPRGPLDRVFLGCE